MIRRSCSVLATSVLRIFPSEAFIFNWLQFVAVSFPSCLSRTFNTLQYFLGFGVSARTWHTSTIEKYHSSCCLCQTFLTLSLKKNSSSLSFSISASTGTVVLASSSNIKKKKIITSFLIAPAQFQLRILACYFQLDLTNNHV